MKPYGHILALAAAALLAQSCLIENDMSYPRILANVVAFAVEGQESCTIDADSRTVTIVLEETADPASLKVTESALSEGASSTDFPQADAIIDLTETRTYTLSTYQDYKWTVTALQPVDRYIRCENQGSSPIINPEMRIANVFVLESQSLQHMTITDMKLEKEGSEIYLVTAGPDGAETVSDTPCVFPMEDVDVLTGMTAEVRYDDVKVRWKIAFEQETVEAEITKANPWCYHVDIEARFDGTGTPYLEYRRAEGTDGDAGDSEWTRFDDLDVDGINISAKVPSDNTVDEGSVRLDPGTQYEFRVCTETSRSDAVTVTTGTPDQIYNMNFNDWYSTKSGAYDIWYPNLNDTYQVWDTANPGSGAFVGSLTTPTASVPVSGQGQRAARLESKNAVIAFAAGNIITGKFKGISGLGAIMDWGTPFTARPKALKGYYAYKPVPVNTAKDPYKNLLNTMDQCQILVFLTDWTAPFTVNTSQNIFVDQSPSNPNIIAYGKMESDKDTFADPQADAGGYIPFTVELDWWRPDATPTYAVVIACASYKGDYFTGGIGSVMYVDEFKFVYD